jgi:hypothetical protein
MRFQAATKVYYTGVKLIQIEIDANKNNGLFIIHLSETFRYYRYVQQHILHTYVPHVHTRYKNSFIAPEQKSWNLQFHAFTQILVLQSVEPIQLFFLIKAGRLRNDVSRL